MADPNWLYSSVVQSSAAIVAIVGGFVTGTVLNLAAKRRGLEEEVDDYEREIALLRRQCEQAIHQRERRRASYLIWDNAERIIDFQRPLPDASKARQQLRADMIAADAFAEEWQEIADEIVREDRQLQADVERFGWGARGFDEWTEKHDIDLTGRNQWLASELYERAWLLAHPLKPHKPESVERSGGESSLFASLPYIPRLPPEIEAQNIAAEREAEAAREEELRRHDAAIVEADKLVSRTEAKLELLRERLVSVQQPPPNLIFGLVALAFLTGGGIVVPLLFMPQPESEFDLIDKVLVVGLFVIGLGLVFAYVLTLLFPVRFQGKWWPSKGVLKSWWLRKRV